MCVAISMEPGTELTLEEVIKMGRANADGVGIAWAEDGVVEWYKSINYSPEGLLKVINDRVGFFRLVHFRLSTVGGVRVDLCHPFEVGPMANPAQRGHSSRVLIHNGHWGRWTDIIDVLRKEGVLPDNGPWSDSRLAAFLAAFDEDWLQVITGRIAVMDGEGNTKLLGNWDTLRPGLKVSNKIWETYTHNWKRSGRDREWAGWGWTAEQWEAKEAYDREQAAKAAQEKKDEQEAKGSEEGSSTGTSGSAGTTQKAGTIHVGSGSPDEGVGAKITAQGGKSGGHRIGGASREVFHRSAGQRTGDYNGEDSKVSVKGNEITYNHTPWQNPATKKWYHIPEESCKGTYYRVEELTPDEARSLLEQATTPVHK